MLPTTTADKLVKLLALATCPTAQPGEVHAAMLAADRMVKAAGLSWSAILTPPAPCQAPPPQDRPRHQEPAPASPQARAARLLAEAGDRLTAWQAGFLGNLSRWQGRVSDRQLDILAEIEGKVGRRAA